MEEKDIKRKFIYLYNYGYRFNFMTVGTDRRVIITVKKIDRLKDKKNPKELKEIIQNKEKAMHVHKRHFCKFLMNCVQYQDSEFFDKINGFKNRNKEIRIICIDVLSNFQIAIYGIKDTYSHPIERLSNDNFLNTTLKQEKENLRRIGE